jgi:hypothetical protein
VSDNLSIFNDWNAVIGYHHGSPRIHINLLDPVFSDRYDHPEVAPAGNFGRSRHYLPSRANVSILDAVKNRPLAILPTLAYRLRRGKAHYELQNGLLAINRAWICPFHRRLCGRRRS